MDQTINFITYLKWSSQVEINNLKIVLNYNQAKWQKNMYFVCWLWTKTFDRCSDDDIKLKKYFVVDIDIRLLHYQKTNIVLTQEELLEKFPIILELLNNNWLWDYSAVCDSWNGMHLYYAWTERIFDKEIYSNGVKYIYEQIDQVIKETWYSCDPACTNLARIMRLPWSINPRKKEKQKQILWDLWDWECKILEFNPKISFLFDWLEEFAGAYKIEREQEKNDHIQIKEVIRTEYKKSDDIWKQINEIPACDIACDIRWVTLSTQWLENIALKEEKKNMGAYWYKPKNLIMNTGSSLIKTQKRYFTSYELVYYELMNQDKKRTIEYFRDKYWIHTSQEAKKLKSIEIPKQEYKRQGYLYGNSTFDALDCMMSWELVTVVAQSNSWKTTFAMNIIQTNVLRWKKCFYINLEFPIETVWESSWLYLNWKKKRNLTDIEPLTPEQEENKRFYIQKKLSQFDYHNNPNGMKIEDIVEMIINKNKDWYWLFVLDTFSRIIWNLESAIAHTSQNKSIWILQELCQWLWIVIVLLHHTNKAWKFEWTQKIMDTSNVFIMIEKDQDMDCNNITKFELTKDKFITKIEIWTYYNNQEYSLAL